MRHKLPRAEIHGFRERYNKLALSIHEAVKNKSLSEEYLDRYPLVKVQVGLSCDICGMNNWERLKVHQAYESAIKEMEEILLKST